MKKSSNVAIIHPWFPQYRREFVACLQELGNAAGINIHFYYGDPPPEWNERGDAIQGNGTIRLPTRFLKIGKRSLSIKNLHNFRTHGKYDLVIVEQAVRNLETYMLLLGRNRSELCFWGHGKTYTTRTGALQEAVKNWLTLRGKWFFAYTHGGVNAVKRIGFPEHKITEVRNSIDSSALRQAIEALSSGQLSNYRQRHGLTDSTCFFIGGLDDSKRLPMLLAAAELIHASCPDFRLIIAGQGSGQAMVEEREAVSEWLVYRGSLFDEEKALAFASSRLLLMPGRVGLVAVDSFAAGTPIVTTEWEWHAPEFEYLENDVNAKITTDDVRIYADAVVELLRNPERILELKKNALEKMDQYTVERMAGNFLEGVRLALESP